MSASVSVGPSTKNLGTEPGRVPPPPGNALYRTARDGTSVITIGAGQPPPGGRHGVMQGVMQKALAVLTPAQLAEWTKLTGAPFKGAFDFPPPGFPPVGLPLDGEKVLIIRDKAPLRRLLVLRPMTLRLMAIRRTVHRRTVVRLSALRGCSRVDQAWACLTCIFVRRFPGHGVTNKGRDGVADDGFVCPVDCAPQVPFRFKEMSDAKSSHVSIDGRRCHGPAANPRGRRCPEARPAWPRATSACRSRSTAVCRAGQPPCGMPLPPPGAADKLPDFKALFDKMDKKQGRQAHPRGVHRRDEAVAQGHDGTCAADGPAAGRNAPGRTDAGSRYAMWIQRGPMPGPGGPGRSGRTGGSGARTRRLWRDRADR